MRKRRQTLFLASFCTRAVATMKHYQDLISFTLYSGFVLCVPTPIKMFKHIFLLYEYLYIIHMSSVLIQYIHLINVFNRYFKWIRKILIWCFILYQWVACSYPGVGGSLREEPSFRYSSLRPLHP